MLGLQADKLTADELAIIELMQHPNRKGVVRDKQSGEYDVDVFVDNGPEDGAGEGGVVH